MIVGLGIDLVEHSRVERELARGDWLLGNGIFSSQEIQHCSNGRRPALRYAACFAAKEATLKALGVVVSDLAIFREVEVGSSMDSKYAVVLHHRLKSESQRLGVRRIRLSLAATAKQTGAMVILES